MKWNEPEEQRHTPAVYINKQGSASALSTPLRWIFKKMRYKKLFTPVESHASAVSLLESGE